MIELYINSNKADIQLEGEKTIGDVLMSFEKTCEENNAAVIGIQIDGNQITAEKFDEISKKELQDNTKFEFSVVTKQTIIESFSELSVLFEELSVKMENLPYELQTGKKAESAISIQNLADNIENFCKLASLASLFPETFNASDFRIGNLNLRDFLEDFSPVLKDFESALETNDTVLTGDLAEYEISPRLKQISEFLKLESEKQN